MAVDLCQAFKDHLPKECKTLSTVPPTQSLTFEEIKKGDDNIFANNFFMMVLAMFVFGLASICVLYCCCQTWLRSRVNSEMEHTKIAKKYGPYIEVKEESLKKAHSP